MTDLDRDRAAGPCADGLNHDMIRVLLSLQQTRVQAAALAAGATKDAGLGDPSRTRARTRARLLHRPAHFIRVPASATLVTWYT